MPSNAALSQDNITRVINVVFLLLYKRPLKIISYSQQERAADVAFYELHSVRDYIAETLDQYREKAGGKRLAVTDNTVRDAVGVMLENVSYAFSERASMCQFPRTRVDGLSRSSWATMADYADILMRLSEQQMYRRITGKETLYPFDLNLMTNMALAALTAPKPVQGHHSDLASLFANARPNQGFQLRLV